MTIAEILDRVERGLTTWQDAKALRAHLDALSAELAQTRGKLDIATDLLDTTMLREYEARIVVQPCGHFAAAIITAGDGRTNWCGECAREARSIAR